ncbi:hypothetical protein [Flavobacterium undicola]|uniref:hypothetical protein n=1 Tax=Flavobacterium undicola TaxID=1932779 RepID=UPI0013773E32|nr:hypothetical protein [Flavobacterium undicola]MBA0885156.1 hypothetical protein [Flavobacterium undicola]
MIKTTIVEYKIIGVSNLSRKKNDMVVIEKTKKLYLKPLKKEIIVLIKAIAIVQLFVLYIKNGILKKSKTKG